MAVAFDFSIGGTTTGTTLTLAVDPSAITNLMLVVGACWRVAETLSSALYDGGAMNVLGSGTNGGHRWQFWDVIGPNSASKNAVLTFSGSTFAAAVALVVKDAKQEHPVQTATDVNASSSSSLTALTGENFLTTFQAWRQDNLDLPTDDWTPGTGSARAKASLDGEGNGIRYGLGSGSNTTGEAWSEQNAENAENVLMTIDFADFIAVGSSILTRGGKLSSGGLLAKHGSLG